MSNVRQPVLDKSFIDEKQGSLTGGLQVAPVGAEFASLPRRAGLSQLCSLSKASQAHGADSYSGRADSSFLEEC